MNVEESKSEIHSLDTNIDCLNLEPIKDNKIREEQLIQISEYPRIVPQIHSKIDRLYQKNDDLSNEIFKLKSIAKTLGIQIQFLMEAKVRERKLAIRQLIDYIKQNENLQKKLSSKSFEIIHAIKSELNTTTYNYSKEQIREAIQNESRPVCKACFIEMYILKFGSFAEVNVFDTEMDYILNKFG